MGVIKVTDRNHESESNRQPDDASSRLRQETVYDAGSTTRRNPESVTDNPFTHIQSAHEARLKGNAKTAERELKAAIVAADKLDIETYKKQLEQVNAAIKEGSPAESRTQELITLKGVLETVINIPVSSRLYTADFYLKNAKPDEAKVLLDQAQARDASLKEKEEFKQLAEAAQSMSKDNLQKALSFCKNTLNEIASDWIGGTLALTAFDIVPGGKLLKLSSALIAGGIGKHETNKLIGVDSTWKHDMLWGGVDALAFVSGIGMRNNLIGGVERGLSKDAIDAIIRNGSELGLKNFEAKETALLGRKTVLEQALAGSIVADPEKLAARQTLAGCLSRSEKKALENVLSGTATHTERNLLSEKIGSLTEVHTQLTAERDAFTAQVNTLTGADGPHGLKGLDAATQLLAKGVAGAEERAAKELSNAIAKAPLWQKPLLWAQGHSPLLWRIPNKSLASYQELEKEALAVSGSTLNILNPFNSVVAVENYSSLKNLKARSYWTRFRIDQLSIGTGSLVFNAPQEAAKVGTVDPTTGHRYSVYDAMGNTIARSTVDGIGGALLVGMGRGMGNTVRNSTRSLGDTSLSATPMQSAESRWSELKGRLLDDLRKTAAVAEPQLAIFSPRLANGFATWQDLEEVHDLLNAIDTPIVDTNPEQPVQYAPNKLPVQTNEVSTKAKTKEAKPTASTTGS